MTEERTTRLRDRMLEDMLIHGTLTFHSLVRTGAICAL